MIAVQGAKRMLLSALGPAPLRLDYIFLPRCANPRRKCCWRRRAGQVPREGQLGPPGSCPFCFFGGQGSATKIDYRKKVGTLILRRT